MRGGSSGGPSRGQTKARFRTSFQALGRPRQTVRRCPMTATDAPSSAPSSIEMLKRLVAFDTTSRNSNLDLIKYIQSYLEDFGVASTLVPNAEGTKANLYA